jgi:negative regulator of flagellin synthesis FlgM
MQIFGPYRVSTTPPTSPTNRTQRQSPAEATGKASVTPQDQLDLSSQATGINRISPTEVAATGEIRIDRVADIRRQIADGSYETPEKIDAALDKFLDRFA